MSELFKKWELFLEENFFYDKNSPANKFLQKLDAFEEMFAGR